MHITGSTGIAALGVATAMALSLGGVFAQPQTAEWRSIPTISAASSPVPQGRRRVSRASHVAGPSHD